MGALPRRTARRSVALAAIGLMISALGVLAAAGPAAAASAQIRVDARVEPSAPGVPGVATGVQVSPDRPVTLTATGTATCSSSPQIQLEQDCADRDANGTGLEGFLPQFFLAPDAPTHSLVARVGDGPLVFVGTGPTELTGTGELRLSYNDIPGLYGDNSGGFDVSVRQTRDAALRYTGPTNAVLVGGALTVSGSVTDVDAGTPSGRLGEARVRFTLQRPNGAVAGTCTAAVRAASATVGNARCAVRVPGPVALGRYRVSVELVEGGPYVAPPAQATLRLVSVG